MQYRSVALLALVFALSTPRTGHTAQRFTDDELTQVASQALSWAIADGIPAAKELPANEPLYVVSHNLPKAAKLQVADRTVTQESAILFQGRVDLSGTTRAIFTFGRFARREERITTSLTLSWVTPEKDKATPRPPQGAEIELEKVGNSWKVTKVTSRWP